MNLNFCLNYARENVVFWRNLHYWQKFYTATGSDGRNKSYLWITVAWDFARLSVEDDGNLANNVLTHQHINTMTITITMWLSLCHVLQVHWQTLPRRWSLSCIPGHWCLAKAEKTSPLPSFSQGQLQIVLNIHHWPNWRNHRITTFNNGKEYYSWW